MKVQIYRANIINPRADGQYDLFSPGYLVVSEAGKIVSIDDKLDLSKYPQHTFVDCGDNLLLPGFIDTHTHLSQYAFAGIGSHSLLPWLNTYTFPQEQRFNDASVAAFEAKNFFQECLSLGTTTVVAYVTKHTEATDASFEAAQASGIRAFLGKVLMDTHAPKELLEDAPKAVRECEKLISKWHQKTPLLNFIVSPRFAVSCTDQLLVGAGELAREHKLCLQTHLSENVDEVKLVSQLYPWAQDYTDVYEKTGCLTERTLLGHCIHLSDREIARIKERGSIVVHCPTSNRFLSSGAMPLVRFKKQGLKLSLGTDVAAGTSLSMFSEMREACETSKSLGDAIGLLDALRLATLDGAKALGIDSVTGNLEPGKDADFILVDCWHTHPLKSAFGGSAQATRESLYNSILEKLSRLLYRPHPEMIQATFVGGQQRFKAQQTC